MTEYTTKISLSQMAEDSKKATEEGMRQLAIDMVAAEATKPHDSSDSSDMSSSDSFDSSDSDSKSRGRSRKNKHRHVKIHNRNSKYDMEKLENRIHYLTLDLANSTVDTDNLRLEVESLKKRMTPFIRVNDELAFIKSSMNRAFNNIDKLYSQQLVQKSVQFHEEAFEHITLCSNAIATIHLDEVRISMLRILDAERRKVKKIENSYQSLILKTRIKEVLSLGSIWVLAFTVLIAVLYQMLV